MVLWMVIACGSPGSGGPTTPGAAPSPVHVLRVARTTEQADLELPGTVAAERSVTLRPETTGLVVRVDFDHGDRVEEGQVLVQLQDALQRAAVREAQAQVDLAKSQLDRTTALVERQNASRADLDRATAEDALARARLDEAREALRRTVVRAPFAGTVGLRRVVRGDLVDPSRALTTLVGGGPLSVDVAVAERDLAVAVVGGRATVEVDAAPGVPFEGTLGFVAPAVDEGTRTFAVRVRLDAEDERLRPGMTARVHLSGSFGEALRVPTQAVLTTARGSAVYVVDADGKAQMRPVVTADRDESTLSVVKGLEEGDVVVIDGLVRLRPGNLVRVLE